MAETNGDERVLVVPGFHGSGPGHWQSWLERELPQSRRVTGIDWERPVLSAWADAIARDIDAGPGRIWVVAHSFGCLASAVAIAERRERVAGAVLVAPADPERFSAAGARSQLPRELRHDSIAARLPASPLVDFGLLVASRDDPWMRYADARRWSERWGLALFDAGRAGHINVESGHGRWPLLLELLDALRRAAAPAAVAIGRRACA